MKFNYRARANVPSLHGHILDGDMVLIKVNNTMLCVWNWVHDTWGSIRLDNSAHTGDDWVGVSRLQSVD